MKTNVTNIVKAKHAEFYSETALINRSTTMIWYGNYTKNYTLSPLDGFVF